MWRGCRCWIECQAAVEWGWAMTWGWYWSRGWCGWHCHWVLSWGVWNGLADGVMLRVYSRGHRSSCNGKQPPGITITKKYNSGGCTLSTRIKSTITRCLRAVDGWMAKLSKSTMMVQMTRYILAYNGYICAARLGVDRSTAHQNKDLNVRMLA